MRNCVSGYYSGLCLVVALICIHLNASAQVINCPPNFNFEEGNFGHWECRTGVIGRGTADNVIYSWQGNGPAENRHTIIPAQNAGTDMYGGFPIRCPNGAPYTVRLGNDNTGAEVESMSYTLTIPAGSTNYSVVYYYAVVFEDPSHPLIEQPRFVVNVSDANTGVPLPCVTFDFTAVASLPGFTESPRKANVLYKSWTPVSIDLSEYAGRTIKLEFLTMDCLLGAHFGYAYVALDPTCSGGVVGNILCGEMKPVTLSAPFGYQSYTWYSDANFSTVLGNGQTLDIPAPVNGAVIPLRLVPFPGFGCEDTLYAPIKSSSVPVSVAGADRDACRLEPVQLGGPPVNGYGYEWSPANAVSDPTSSAPLGFSARMGVTEFVVKTVNMESGCFSYDTVLVNARSVNTLAQATNLVDYCEGETINTVFRVANDVTDIQWHRNNTPLNGAVNRTYTPAVSGQYFAVVSQNGCRDTTNRFNFNIRPVPVVALNNTDDYCARTPVSFINNSTIAGASPLHFRWLFSDGVTSTERHAQRNFSSAGTLNVKLVAASEYGCSDSLETQIVIKPRAIADFAWTGVCENLPVNFVNSSDAQGSVANYHWNFGNGSTSDAKQPAPVTFPGYGSFQVLLVATSDGCENAPDSIVKMMRIDALPPPLTYPKIYIAQHENVQLHARSIGSVFQWQPAASLSNPAVRQPVFTGAESTVFTVDISNPGGCPVVDTVEVVVVKEAGVWVPTAFSPNGDGLNDFLRPFVVGNNQLTRFSVYNRQGTRVFSSASQSVSWNGQYNGTLLPAGVYVWYVEYKDETGSPQVKKGALTLVR